MKGRSYYTALPGRASARMATQLSSGYYELALYLDETANAQPPPVGYLRYGSIVFYVSSVECYLNEAINIGTYALGSDLHEDLANLANRTKNCPLNREKLKLIDQAFAISISCALCAEDLLALVDVRHEMIHYQPTFQEESTRWPLRIRQALQRSKADYAAVSNWTTALSDPMLARWARLTVKAFLKEFHAQAGGQSPFDAPEPLRWRG